MPDIATLIAQGSSNLWLFIPSAILLGALHGLEPGHSKTMMAAFIVAVRGTVTQAMLLGLAATISHTAVVWVVALVGMQLGSQYDAQTTEPYFQLISGVLIIGMALWMVWRTRHAQRTFDAHGHHDHAHDHHHHHDHDHHHHHDEPHTGHDHDHGTEHGHAHAQTELDIITSGCEDAHALAHANDIRRRFANRQVTTGQIILFGLTGGLIPCPASITVLLICLQLKKVALGATLVLCFSIGLAITLMSVGAIAAYSMHHVGKRWSGFSEFARRAPYFSGVLIGLVGLYVIYHGWYGLR